MRDATDVDCEHASWCFNGWRMGKGCYPDEVSNSMGGKPWHECHCMTPDEKRTAKCVYCNGTGEIEMDNNGPIVTCPVCEGATPSEERKP